MVFLDYLLDLFIIFIYFFLSFQIDHWFFVFLVVYVLLSVCVIIMCFQIMVSA